MNMTCLKFLWVMAFVSVVAAGHLGHFQPSFGYSAFGSNAYSSASASAYTSNYGVRIPIVRYENVNNGDGTYRYNYQTGNGISAHENGAPHASGAEGLAVTADGGYSYTAPDGQQVVLSYTADENGFRPIGSHIPTPPPIPEDILRSIEFNRQNPSSGARTYNGHYHQGYNK